MKVVLADGCPFFLTEAEASALIAMGHADVVEKHYKRSTYGVPYSFRNNPDLVSVVGNNLGDYRKIVEITDDAEWAIQTFDLGYDGDTTFEQVVDVRHVWPGPNFDVCDRVWPT